ncbi:flagellar hook-associated protein FlgK [Cellulomonas sp. WB94]|uniref:flagellar hook-associated protein FlgK n=1 Tax=Cellulomonas sp. WB94 TaxID=2173174 RepID=UPI000D56D1CE|nr:flagellar hook-associated protein FlgK [Cellulomonas sp. WB94]PVU83374.1 flagellar hook-associated protein FlgK [Cellulomonas sp. WB94]
MSTFSGLGTALSSLIAQRQALEVSGQNIANANTVGYTRQRASISSLPAASVSSMFSTNNGPGQGTRVTGIERLGDLFIDARVRSETAGSAYLSARASAYTTLEQGVGEPSTTGLSTQLSNLWGAFSDVANTPNKDSARAVLLETANAVVDRIATLYDAAATQWTQARTTTVALVDQVNTIAANVADLNTNILAITNSGGSANELMDQRDQLVTQLSGLVGATARVRDNGTVDVLVAGNALVSGATTTLLVVTGPTVFSGATAGQSVGVEWASRPGIAVGLDGGRVAGLLSVLAPPSGGAGGILTEAAASYDGLATKIATSVNALHATATTVGGAPGGAFFAIDATKPASLGLSVAITDPTEIAVAAATKGALDGSVADKIAALGLATDGPDATWSAVVVQLGVRTASATSRSSVAEASRASAASQQLAQTSVDVDEESTNMLAYQRAYEGSARVLTAIDSMLDTLINRTGLVGR